MTAIWERLQLAAEDQYTSVNCAVSGPASKRLSSRYEDSATINHALNQPISKSVGSKFTEPFSSRLISPHRRPDPPIHPSNCCQTYTPASDVDDVLTPRIWTSLMYSGDVFVLWLVLVTVIFRYTYYHFFHWHLQSLLLSRPSNAYQNFCHKNHYSKVQINKSTSPNFYRVKKGNLASILDITGLEVAVISK